MIWTTTPWTIPANQALNVASRARLRAGATRRAAISCSREDLVEACLARYKLDGHGRRDARKGAALERIAFRHPFYDRASPVYLGEYVTLEQGTGIVHSVAGVRRRGLPVVPPLRHEGRRDPEPGAGRRPLRREPAVLRRPEDLGGESADRRRSCARRGALLHAEKFTHSYMHCWRHKTPIIYRATTQWFAGMDDVPGYGGAKPERDAARRRRCAGIEATQFFPAWGKARLYGMIANRPDWTLSRQRQWGVPLPFFVAQETDELHPRHARRCSSTSRSTVEQGGIEAWFDARRARTSASTPAKYRKITDTLDVWFDSGSTHQTVMGGPDGAQRPARARTPQDTRFPGRPLSRRLRPASRLVPFVAARLVHAERRAAVQGAADARLRRRRRRPEDVEVEGQRRRAAEGLRHARRGDPAAVGRRRPTTRASCRSPTRS